jgi:hypothetical protein
LLRMSLKGAQSTKHRRKERRPMDHIANLLQLLQTSTTIHHPEHDSSSTNSSRSPASADPDALLHPPDSDPRAMSARWQGERYIKGLQVIESKFVLQDCCLERVQS